MIKQSLNLSLEKPNLPILWLLAGVSFFWMLFAAAPASAQIIDPEDRTAEITATVPDHNDPTTPILIEPENNALLNTAAPTFIWRGSTDDVAISHYVIYLDGEIWFDNLPTAGASNSSYTLTYNSTTSYYSFTARELIDNGTSTWKIAAVDTSDNTAESVTWTFTIDTSAPAFVIDTIGGVEAGISNRDTDTIPGSPIELSENEPLLTGTGESNSTVDVTIETPDETENASFTIGSSGSWELQLGILPRDVIIYLDFVIEDQAGNISILLNIPFIIRSQLIPLPTSLPGLPTAPPETQPQPSAPPTEPPSIEKPFPKELRSEFLKAVEAFMPLSLQEITRDRLLQVPEPLPLYFRAFEFGALLVILLPAFTSLIILIFKFGRYTPLSSMPMLAALAGLLPRRKDYHGLVFVAESGGDVSFARVIFSGIAGGGERIYTQVITDAYGYFEPPPLPPGNYVCGVIHPAYSFPTSYPKPEQLQQRDYYLGGQIAITEEGYSSQLCIPVDLEQPAEVPVSHKIIKSLEFGRMISLLSLIAATGITILFPSVWNFLAVGIYCSLVMLRTIQLAFQPASTLLSKDGHLIKQGVLRFSEYETDKTISITKTDQNGRYKYPKFIEMPADHSVKQIVLIKQGWKLASADSPDLLIAEKI